MGEMENKEAPLKLGLESLVDVVERFLDLQSKNPPSVGQVTQVCRMGRRTLDDLYGDGARELGSRV